MELCETQKNLSMWKYLEKEKIQWKIEWSVSYFLKLIKLQEEKDLSYYI